MKNGKSRDGRLNVDDCQKYSRFSPGKEGELSIQTHTHTNAVLRSVGTEPELNDRKHVFFKKHRDLLVLEDGGSLQFSEVVQVGDDRL